MSPGSAACFGFTQVARVAVYLLIPYCWRGKRVLHPLVWLDNRGVEVFTASYLWSV